MSDTLRIDDLRRRVQKDPASIAFAQLAEEHRRLGQYREAVDVCRAGLAVHPTYLSARVTLGRALLELGELDPAQHELQLVLASAPDNLAATRGLAEILHKKGALLDALAQYRRALGLARNDPDLEQIVADLARDVARRPPQPAPVSSGPAQVSSPRPEGSGLLTLEQLADELQKQVGQTRGAAVAVVRPAAPTATAAAAKTAVGPVASPAPSMSTEPTRSTAAVVIAQLERWLVAIDGYRAERRA
ncbi:MAG: tetratricopeptide repeat protein [Vicinamibacterales bacterium]